MKIPWNSLQLLVSHPLTRQDPLAALSRYVRYHVGQRLLPYPFVFDWVGPLRLLLRLGWAGVVGNFYCGLYDYESMFFLLHSLNPDEMFFDVGANAGVYSLLAAGICQAQVMAIEPVPSNFEILEAQLRLNRLEDQIHPLQIGIGAEIGELFFSLDRGTMNHVITAPVAGQAVQQVAVSTLDELSAQYGQPSLIKLDIEGFELPALQGGANTLANPKLFALIVELAGSGVRYGYLDEHNDKLLRQHGFVPCSYDPRTRRLEILARWRSDLYNTLYIRDPEQVSLRLQAAKPVNILGQTI